MEGWVEKYQEHLYLHIAPLVIPDSTENAVKLRKKFVNNESMKYHIRGVTHESFDPNQTKNYETPEFIGDSIMGLTYPQIYAEKFPNTDEETLTNLKSAKLWKNEQAKISRKLGLDQFIRSVIPITIDMREDVLEALFWSVMEIGNNIFGPGVGYVMCKNLMINLYSDSVVLIDAIDLKNPKALLKEIGDKLHWYDGPSTINAFGVPKENVDKYQKVKKWRLVFRLTPRAQAWMHAHGKNIVNNGVLADVTNVKKKDAEDDGAIQALKNLKDLYDLDWRKADEYKIEPEYSDDVKRQMKKDKFVNIEVIKHKDIDYYQLVGTKEDGTKSIALTVFNDTSATVTNVEGSIITRYGIIGSKPLGELIRLK